jgi:pyruvate/2-oxoglutarate dehydrogenase complex dihydrolipoamide dehydrogenase (E3) component
VSGGVELLRNHTAQGFDSSGRTVDVTDDSGRNQGIAYDAALIATGARPIIPRIPDIEAPGVFPLHTMDGSFRVHWYLAEHEPSSAVIVGSGYIGLEMADALTHRGLQVTLIGRSKTVLSTVDASFGRTVEDTLRGRGVRVESG